MPMRLMRALSARRMAPAWSPPAGTLRSRRSRPDRRQSCCPWLSGPLAAPLADTPRHVLHVFDVPGSRGSAGIAFDASNTEALRDEIARTVAAHRRTLDQLATGVAIFGADHSLAFYNSAYRALWDFEAAYLDRSPGTPPSSTAFVPTAGFPNRRISAPGRRNSHQAYRATAPERYQWHLPDQRTLRVVITPRPDGGVTYLLRRRDRTAQSRTPQLMHRSACRAKLWIFSPKPLPYSAATGRVSLFNPGLCKHVAAFRPQCLPERPHVEAVIERCRLFHHDGRHGARYGPP